jgi:hypothetical protein
MSAHPKQQPMCAVTIGYETYLMPASAGMKVVELMQQAISTERTYGMSKHEYEAGEAPSVSYHAVRPSQIKMPPGAEMTPAPAQKRIAQQPLRLSRKD